MLNKKQVLIVVAPNNFQDYEYEDPREELERAGFLVKVASLEPGIARGNYGSEAPIDLLINQVYPSEFQAIVFVGGKGMTLLLDNPELQKLAQDFAKEQKIIAAICIAPVILAKAGIMQGKKMTVHASGEFELEKLGLKSTKKEVEIDGNFITANGPEASLDFAIALVRKLNE